MDTSQLERIKTLLLAKRLKIAVAESLTCGRLQARFGSISGASDFFEGGVTAYNIRQKIHLLGVDPAHAQSVNSISQRVAFDLAAGACKLFQADIGIATTGYAEPNPENEIAEPMAYIAICSSHAGNIQHSYGRQIFGNGLDRIEMQEFVCDTALAILLTYLENCEPAR